MTRHFVSFAVLWAVLTAVTELLLFMPFPIEGSEFAKESDGIVRYLLAIGTPVFAMAISVIIYSMFQFRAKDMTETGATFRGTGIFPKAWLVVTGGLAAAVMIYPGLTGLAGLQDNADESGWGDSVKSGQDHVVIVNVTGFRWDWSFEYPDLGIELIGHKEPLVVPEHYKVQFRIKSTDVVHSFWVPAWRMKIDAIPGRTTFMTVEPDKLGWSNWSRFPQWSDTANPTGTENDVFRVQCAELCGADHGLMRFDLRIVDEDTWQTWVKEHQAAGGK